MIILLALAAVLVALPIAAAVLVSLASLREDSRHSLSGRAPSAMARAARRLLSVQPLGVMRGPGRVLPKARVPRPRRPQPRESQPRESQPGDSQPGDSQPGVPDDQDLASWLTGPQA